MNMHPSKERSVYYGLQVARGMAALLVVLHHATLGASSFYGSVPFAGFWEFGSIGVDFFFVLSGFIIYSVHAGDSEGIRPAKSYIQKRLVRIYPPFLPISLLLLVAYSLDPSLSHAQRELGVLTSILLIPTPPLEPALSVSWTLMHEMLFYTVFLVMFARRTLFFPLMGLWALTIIAANIIAESKEGLLLGFILNPHNLQFLLGIVAALLVKRVHGSALFLGIGISMIALYVMEYTAGGLGGYSLLAVKSYLGIGFMLLVTGLCLVEERIKYPAFLVFLGSASYSIYLIHNPAVSILNRIAAKLHTLLHLPAELLFLFTAGGGITAGIVYYLLWERPGLAFFKRVLRADTK